MSLLKGYRALPQELIDQFKELRDQARSHTSLDGLDRLIKLKRPSETDEIQAFRIRNQRKYTLVESQAFYNMIAMIFTNSGMTTLVSDLLSEYLDTSPFRVNYKDMDLNTWFFHSAFPDGCEDSNGIFLVYPQKDDYSDDLKKNTPQVKFFTSDQYKGSISYTLNQTIGDELQQAEDYIYFAVELQKSGIGITNYYEHWLISKDKYIVLRDVKGEKEPVLIWWYQHKSGSYPLVSPPSKDITYKSYKIRLSLMAGMFEWWDEALTRGSDAQAIANKADYPTLVVPQIPCKAPGCFQGFLTGHTPENPKPCPNCGGSKYNLMNSPFASISIPSTDGLSEMKGLHPYWMSPDVAIVNNSFDKSIQLLEIGRTKGGMTSIEAQNVESGLARSMRFQSKQELLGNIASLTKMFLESTLYYMEILLQPDDAKRQMPVVIFKSNLNVKDEESMRLEAMESPLADRPASFMTWISEKYKGNAPYIRAWDISLQVTTLIVMNQEELSAARLDYDDFWFYLKDVILGVTLKIIEADQNKDNDEKKLSDEVIIDQAMTIIRTKYELIKPQIKVTPISLFDANKAGQAQEPAAA